MTLVTYCKTFSGKIVILTYAQKACAGMEITMEENYWKQFCSTGAVEDYLRYTDSKVEQEEKAYEQDNHIEMVSKEYRKQYDE